MFIDKFQSIEKIPTLIFLLFLGWIRNLFFLIYRILNKLEILLFYFFNQVNLQIIFDLQFEILIDFCVFLMKIIFDHSNYKIKFARTIFIICIAVLLGFANILMKITHYGLFNVSCQSRMFFLSWFQCTDIKCFRYLILFYENFWIRMHFMDTK